MMHSIDESGRLVRVSNFWAATLEYTPEEMVGRKSVEFLSEKSKAYAVEVLREFYRTGHIYNVSYEFVAKSGRIVPVLMSAVAQLNAEGEFIRSLAMMYYNKLAENRISLTVDAQRMAALGRLVGGVAHDFNNLLSIILGNIELIEETNSSFVHPPYVRDIKNAVERGKFLTQNLLMFGRKTHLHPTDLDVNATTTEICEMLRRVLPENIKILQTPTVEPWLINVDHRLLVDAIINLGNNARDAMPDGGLLTVETAVTHIAEDQLRFDELDVLPGEYVMIAVSDTGHGMDRETLAQVFEPYYTTKPIGKG
ncbi:MAG: histidine kinase dimerization/phospho-acceptor domain-containing protein, partial [Pseudomonadota bacterium]